MGLRVEDEDVFDGLYSVSNNVASAPWVLFDGEPFKGTTGSPKEMGSCSVRSATSLSGDVMKAAIWFDDVFAVSKLA